jgi:hypothetical protein
MNSKDPAKDNQSEAGLTKTLDGLKKKVDGETDRGDMPVDSSLGHPDMKKGADEERLPPDDDEN